VGSTSVRTVTVSLRNGVKMITFEDNAVAMGRVQWYNPWVQILSRVNSRALL